MKCTDSLFKTEVGHYDPGITSRIISSCDLTTEKPKSSNSLLLLSENRAKVLYVQADMTIHC